MENQASRGGEAVWLQYQSQRGAARSSRQQRNRAAVDWRRAVTLVHMWRSYRGFPKATGRSSQSSVPEVCVGELHVSYTVA